MANGFNLHSNLGHQVGSIFKPVNRPPSPLGPTPSAPRSLRSLPASIWVLGLGSLFMDTSSELIHSLLPVFMTAVLGAGMITVGFVEGVAEAAASITKVFSGVLSDYVSRRKSLVVII